jgi:hypothetical protein
LGDASSKREQESAAPWLGPGLPAQAPALSFRQVRLAGRRPGPDFFEDLITHPEVEKAHERYLDGAFLRQGQARGSFEYGGIVFEEYRGRVGTVDFTDASKAYFFPVGVPGLFRQYNAPADFVETANTIGLPRYAKQAVDQQFARWVMLHVQSNPLQICTRPWVLIKGKRT